MLWFTMLTIILIISSIVHHLFSKSCRKKGRSLIAIQSLQDNPPMPQKSISHNFRRISCKIPNDIENYPLKSFCIVETFSEKGKSVDTKIHQEPLNNKVNIEYNALLNIYSIIILIHLFTQ